MTSFLSRLFGKDKSKSGGTPYHEIERVLEGTIEKAGFDLTFELAETSEGFQIDFAGNDASLVTAREGMVLDSFQIFIKRMLQNKFPDQQFDVQVDCGGFVEASAQELRELADKLKAHVLERGGSSYVRALPPRERKIVHRHLAEDARVKSQSIGDGFCKKIRISLAREAASIGAQGQNRRDQDQEPTL